MNTPVVINNTPSIADNLRKYGRIALVIILGIVLIYAAVRIYQLMRRPANAQYIQGGGQIPAGWDPLPLTDELFSIMDGANIFTVGDSVFAKFNALNDNQMIAVYNKWNEKYSTKPVLWGLAGTWGTLTQAVKDESDYIAFGPINNRDLMLANLDRLRLP